MLADCLKETMLLIAKQTKDTNRLFRINKSIYLYKGKFYKSDIYNIQAVLAKTKPSAKNLPDVCSFVEYTDEWQLKNIFNV